MTSHIEETLKVMTPELYQRFKRAVELGKWPDGKKLSAEQTQICLQSIIAWEMKNLPPEQRTGYIAPKETPCDTGAEDETQPLQWQ